MYESKYQTKADINDAIEHLKEARGLMKYVGISSDLIYQARMEQSIRSVDVAIDDLSKIRILHGDKNVSTKI